MWSPGNRTEKNSSKLHYRYTIGILIGVIVLLLATNWSSVTGLPEMINMALALSSLILAGLAIVYSFLTSGSLTKTLYKIEESSQAIKQTSASMEKSNSELREKVETIPSAIASVKETVDKSHKVLETMPGNFDSKKEDQAKTDKNLPSELVLQYIRTASVGTLDGIMIFHIAHEKNLAIKFNELLEEINNDYHEGAMYGAFDTIYAFNLAEIHIKKKEEKEGGAEYFIEIENLEINIQENLHKYYKSTIERIAKATNSDTIGSMTCNVSERIEKLTELVGKYGIGK